MSTVRKVAENSLVIFAGNVIERIISFFLALILIRYLGSAEFGKYSLVYSFLSFFQIFANMGIDPIVLRELSGDFKKGVEYMKNAFSLRLCLSLIGILLCWAVLQLLHYSLDIKILIYLASLGIFFSFGTLFNSIFQAKLLMKYPTAITLIIKVIFAGFTILLILLKAKLFYFILLNLLISIVQVFLIYCVSRKFVTISLAADLNIYKELIRNSWPLAISSIFAIIYTRIDQVMLFHMKGKEELGLYAAGVKLAELPIVLAGVFMASVIPLFYQYAKTSPDSFKETYERAFKYLMLFIMPVAVIATVYSRQIVLICYGQGFLPSQFGLAILIWSTVFVYAGLVHSNLLLATNLQRLDIIFTGFSVVLNIFLNFILIPAYGFVGAAVATTVSYGFGVVLSYTLKRTRQFGRVMIRAMVKPLLVSLIAAYPLYFFSTMPSIFKFILSGFIYLCLILIIKGIDTQDLKYAREILFSSLLEKVSFNADSRGLHADGRR